MNEMIQFGGALKALGEGKFTGPLVTFGAADQTDLVGDYFTKDTNFWRDFPSAVPVIYAHGFDKTLQIKTLAGGSVDLTEDDAGIWMTGQLDMADAYEAKIYALIEAGKLGTSSGSAPHLARKEADGESSRITSWPIVEASITPVPCEPQNRLVPLKSFLDVLPAESLKGEYLGDSIEEDLTMAALSRLNDRLHYSVFYDLLYESGVSVAEKVTKIKAAVAEYGETAARIVDAILSGKAEVSVKDAGEALKSLWSPEPSSVEVPVRAGKSFLQYLDSVSAAVSECADEQRRINALRVKEGRVYSASRRQRLTDLRDELDALIAEGDPKVAEPAADEPDPSAPPESEVKAFQANRLRFARDRFDFDRATAGV